MAQLISVKLSRFDGSPWGFRLQGGKDFGTPLIVQKVNNGSPAEAAGLRAGDSVIKVNNIDVFNLRHKDAQEVIRSAGNNFEVTVQRGGTTWRPSVSPVTASIPSPQPSAPASSVSPVTRTSLAHKQQDSRHIGSGHNFSPKPFLNGNSDGQIKSIVNKQYNSPVGIYSEETIAETLSAQAEVLAGGVLGVNFKKNEKNYNAQNSEVFKMVQEADKEPRTPEPAEPMPQSGVVTPTSPALASLRPVQAPETRPHQNGGSSPRTTELPPGQNICAECERLIVGVFVRIKEKNLHVECFKCSTCGTSLKNVGYYNINNKLYCDIHAKLAARQNAPTTNLIPVTVAPGQRAPANTISAALGSHVGPLSPSLSNHGSHSPQNYSQQQQQPSNNTRAYSPETSYRNGYNNYISAGSNYNSNRTSPDENQSPRNEFYNDKTYTSTLTISQANNQEIKQRPKSMYHQADKQQKQELDYNRNPTNFNNYNHQNIIDNKLNKLADDIRDFAFDRSSSKNSTYCNTTTTTIITDNNKEQSNNSYPYDQNDFCVRNTTSDISNLRAALKAPTNNFGGPKPFIGSQITNQNYSTPIINTGNSTLPRPQSQSVTGRFSTLPKPKASPFKAATSFNPKPRPFSLIA